MTVSFAIDGVIGVRSNKKACAAVQALADILPGDYDFASKLEGKILELTIHGCTEMNRTWVGDIQSALERLGPFTVTPAKLQVEVEGEDDILWIGREDEIEEAKREELIEAAHHALEKLTDDERARVFPAKNPRDAIESLVYAAFPNATEDAEVREYVTETLDQFWETMTENEASE